MPPYGAKWPVRARSAKAIEAMTEAPDYEYSSIWFSLNGMTGDFGRYVLEPALENFAHADTKKLRARAERVIFTRVLNFGWTPERFQRLERGRRGGHDGPIERYGKKYQWIALYETLGRIADNMELTERWSDADPFPYEYAEQLIYRDIDASVLAPGGLKDPDDQAHSWFAPVGATFPASPVRDYPSDFVGVPDPLDLISLTGPDGTEWLSLIRHGAWTQNLPPEIAALNAPSLNAWMQIRGYLVPASGVGSLRDWAKEQDWDGRWMPENADVYNRLLAAHPGSPDWDWADGNAEPRGVPHRKMPTEFYQPIAWYGGTGTSRESSGTAEPTGFVPSRMLFEMLALHRGDDFCWVDAGGLAVYDPTAGMDETSTLVLRRSLSDRIANAGYNLFWTVLSYKQRDDHSHGRPGPNYRWITASASYLKAGESVECLSAKAWQRRPYPGGDPKPVEWRPRQTG
jgi:hypothetical protein